jgi:hypothetical protein
LPLGRGSFSATCHHSCRPGISGWYLAVGLATVGAFLPAKLVVTFQFGLDGKNEELDVGQGLPAVTTSGAGNRSGRSGKTINGIDWLVRDIHPGWSAQPASTIYGPEPTRLARVIQRTDSKRLFHHPEPVPGCLRIMAECLPQAGNRPQMFKHFVLLACRRALVLPAPEVRAVGQARPGTPERRVAMLAPHGRHLSTWCSSLPLLPIL